MSLSMEQDTELTELLADLEQEIDKMNNWEQGFIRDQIARHRQYGSDIFMSPKQWATIRKMHDELVGTRDPSDREDDN